MPSNEDRIDLTRAGQVLAARPFSVLLGAKLLALDLGHAETIRAHRCQCAAAQGTVTVRG
jgi:hypothetical protein